MIDSFISALGQPFFLRSLFVMLCLAVVFPLYGNIVVVRQEANIAHTFAHSGLLGVAVGLRFDWSIELSILGSVLLTVLFLYFLGSHESKSQIFHNEIGAQFGLVGAILIVSQMTGYRADIGSYLFGDILLLGSYDVVNICVIVAVCVLLYLFFGKKWYALSLHKNLAKSKNIPVVSAYFVYLVSLGLLIGGAMKIIGVLLVSAFLILPSNFGKMLAGNKAQRNVISVVYCVLVSVLALLFSWYWNTPSGATVVGFLIATYLILSVIKMTGKGSD